MLERLQRLKDVVILPKRLMRHYLIANFQDGLPVCKPGSVLGFFEGLEKNSRGLKQYNGELVRIEMIDNFAVG